jgi:hypothetical protein
MSKAAPVKYAPHFTGQAQGFSPEAYYMYVEGVNPRRTQIIGKITIYGWKLISHRLNHDFPFEILQDHLYFRFTSGRDMQHHDTGLRIDRSNQGQAVIGFKNKFKEENFLPINAKAFFCTFPWRRHQLCGPKSPDRTPSTATPLLERVACRCPSVPNGQRQKHFSAFNVELAIPPAAGFVWQESGQKVENEF